MRPLILAVLILVLALPVRAEDAPAPPPFPAAQRLAVAQQNLASFNATLAALEREYKATRAAAEAAVREIEALSEVGRLTAQKSPDTNALVITPNQVKEWREAEQRNVIVLTEEQIKQLSAFPGASPVEEPKP